ncbi:MAG: GntR family transcriptional regulator [Ruminiclostridium sp.]|nr:GntR family transcriptional regulator [Ruminiclostridium sp.]
MDIILKNSSDEPIYQQIISQIKAQIMNGTLAAGEALPSMRTLAARLRISVITTKRAYEELERDGYIENFTGKGCFVKAQNTDFLREETVRQTEELLAKACERAKLCGLTVNELKEMIELMYEEDNNND